jgi:hypothetical protein
MTQDTKTNTPEMDAALIEGSNLAQQIADHVLNSMGAAGCKIPVNVVLHADVIGDYPEDAKLPSRDFYVIVTSRDAHDNREAQIKRMVDGGDMHNLLLAAAGQIEQLKRTAERQSAKLEVFDVFANLTGVITDLRRNPNSCGSQDLGDILRHKADQIAEQLRPGWERDQATTATGAGILGGQAVARHRD